jgi:hypothetical protein
VGEEAAGQETLKFLGGVRPESVSLQLRPGRASLHRRPARAGAAFGPDAEYQSGLLLFERTEFKHDWTWVLGVGLVF